MWCALAPEEQDQLRDLCLQPKYGYSRVQIENNVMSDMLACLTQDYKQKFNQDDTDLFTPEQTAEYEAALRYAYRQLMSSGLALEDPKE
jgi:hypothetical protein